MGPVLLAGRLAVVVAAGLTTVSTYLSVRIIQRVIWFANERTASRFFSVEEVSSQSETRPDGDPAAYRSGQEPGHYGTSSSPNSTPPVGRRANPARFDPYEPYDDRSPSRYGRASDPRADRV